jgi:hypothetical protein
MFGLSVSGHRAPEDVSLILGRPGAAALSPWAGCVECPANSAWTRAPCPALSPGVRTATWPWQEDLRGAKTYTAHPTHPGE